MKKQILFIQGGGGDGGYKADKSLVASLKKEIGRDYDIEYPELESDESASDFGWIEQVDKKIAAVQSEVILVGHSLGASMLLKYLSEYKVKKKISGIFLIATPFWGGSEDWVQGLKLQEDFAEKLPKNIPIFFYQCRDDEEVPFEQFRSYKQKLPWATFRELKTGGHQFNDDLSIVAKDIESL